jgi:hypothetical protein
VPELAPVRAERRANPLLPWAAGAVLSILVLVLTVGDASWLDRLSGPGPAEPAVVSGPIEDIQPPAPEPASMEPALVEPAGPVPRVVPISPDGRSTAQGGSDASRAVAPVQRGAPLQPLEEASRLVPIMMKRPPSTLPPGLQLVSAVAGEGPAVVEAIDFGRAPAPSAPQVAAPPGIRLFIHYGAAGSGDAATAARLAQYLGRRGFEVAGIRPVELHIGSADLRYFFEGDLAESERLLDDLGWFFRGMPERAPQRASDFTHYTPRPRPGNVEIWLPAAS